MARSKGPKSSVVADDLPSELCVRGPWPAECITSPLPCYHRNLVNMLQLCRTDMYLPGTLRNLGRGLSQGQLPEQLCVLSFPFSVCAVPPSPACQPPPELHFLQHAPQITVQW